MKCCINKVILWTKLDDGNGNKYRRELEFKEDKVNVITGDSNTGKTAILHIIDYCFFASKHEIAESKINENIEWYGIKLKINDKSFTLARKSPTPNEHGVSDEYYFSSVGDVPELPFNNMSEGSLKTILETEFYIDKNVTIPGSNSFKAKSKISLRYFMMFNTISGDIIQHSKVFFDKQNENRYRDALPRIFDLAIGIETIENILKREKKSSLEVRLARIEKKNSKVSEKTSEFKSELQAIASEAKEYGLIREEGDVSTSIDSLKLVVNDGISRFGRTEKNRLDEIISEKGILERRVKNLTRFQSVYSEYKSSLNVIEDSLKPVEYWSDNDEIVKTSIFDKLVSSLEEDLRKVRQLNKNKTPVDGKVTDEISKCRELIKKLEEEENGLPKKVKTFEDGDEKSFFLGQTKAKLDLYTSDSGTNEIASTSKIEEQIAAIDVVDTTENRELCIKVLEEIIQGYMELVKLSLENYGDYLPVFNYKEKKIDFRKPKATHVEASGSSSNDMFKHLFMFLGLHEFMLTKDSKHVPSFLIIDQLSRPYYGEEKKVDEARLQHSDRAKAISAFKLLNSFLDNTLQELKKPFQMIVFEHVPIEYFDGFEHIHVLKEFRDGNALIPQEYLD